MIDRSAVQCAKFLGRNLFRLLLVSVAAPAVAQFGQFDPAGNLVLLSSGNSGRPTLHGPASRLGQPGEPVSLSVAFTGENVTFRWYFNGQPIQGATNDTLLFGSLSASNVGGYFVTATNRFGSVTSEVARVELDSDRDGLGDSWEMSNFGSLTNQNAAMDKDRDGASNQLEFQDGTNPTNELSLLCRLTVRPFGGKVLVSPDLPAYQINDEVVLTGIPDAGLGLNGWSGDLAGATNPVRLVLTGNATVQATFGLPLAFSLNTTNEVITGGAGGWFGQKSVTDDGEAAAAVAPPFAGSDPPYLEATVVTRREGTASFRWRIDGERDNSLLVSVNGDPTSFATRVITGATDWRSKTIYLPAGTNRVRWTYYRNGGGWNETGTLLKPRDTAYVDRLVITEYANPELDADGNGLPDLWEYRYLDVTGTDANSDPDADGVSTKLELGDGTDPNNAESVKPRLSFVVEGQGTATSAPVLNSFEYGQSVSYTATPAPGWHFAGWIGPFERHYLLFDLETNNPVEDHLYFSKAVRAVFGTPPGSAADAPGLTWTTSPEYPWFGQSLVSHDGLHAAQTALTVEPFADTESWLETAVTGPGTLSFFWKASSATNDDYLTLLVDSVEAAGRLSGDAEWRPVVLDLPAGNHMLRWLFKRFYGYDSNALNTAWVDQVRFTPGTSIPEFIDVPNRLQGYETRDLTFRVTARGTPPITYQVLMNGTALTQPAIDETITVFGVTPAMSGNWFVQARNASGSANSTPISVNILPFPVNDDFAQASVFADGQRFFNGYTIGASAEDNEDEHAGWPARASVWHRWTAPFSGGVRFTITATNAPSYVALAIYRGTALGSLTEVASQSVYAELTNGVEVARAAIQWKAVAGTIYSIAIDADDEGTFYQLSWEPVAPPVNDAFIARLPLSGMSLMVSGDNSVATAEPGEPPVVNQAPFFVINASNTLWWSWTAPATGNLWIERQNDSTAAMVSVFTGNSIGSLTRVLDPHSATNAVSVTKDVTYAISADAENGIGGHFTFLLAMDTLFLRVGLPEGSTQGGFELLGRPGTSVAIEFSPNLVDWYPWSSNIIDARGSMKVSLDAETCVDEGGMVSSAPTSATNRFFRAVRP